MVNEIVHQEAQFSLIKKLIFSKTKIQNEIFRDQAGDFKCKFNGKFYPQKFELFNFKISCDSKRINVL